MTHDLDQRLRAYITWMAPHQKDREGGKLLIEAAAEIQRLKAALERVAQVGHTGSGVAPRIAKDALSPRTPRTYKRLKVVNSSGIISDLDGNFTLQCASPRGLRLLRRITKAQSLKAGFSAGSAIPEWAATEIRNTWNAARDSGGELQAFRIIERMVDRLGYGRIQGNLPLFTTEGQQ